LSSGYTIRPKADLDIDEIADYLTAQSSFGMALGFLSEAHRSFALLASQPGMGWQCKMNHPRLKSARMFRVGAPFEDYLIFYQPRGKRIEILRLLHGSQNLDNLL
jgi:toxin ParE1/3/4